MKNDNILVRFFKTLARSGMEAFGKYYSNYRGLVADVNDPLKLQRVQLVIPQVSGNQVYKYWAYPKGVFSGKGYGMQCMPKKGDVVWVEFEGGSPEVPIWSHGHFALQEIPNGTDDEYRDLNMYWFKTPGGNIVKFNDTKKTIHIENPTGQFVEINERGVSVFTNHQIFLGQHNTAAEYAVLGETLESLLKEFVVDVGKLEKIPVTGGVTGKINLSPDWVGFKNKWDARWSRFLSRKVKLD